MLKTRCQGDNREYNNAKDRKKRLPNGGRKEKRGREEGHWGRSDERTHEENAPHLTYVTQSGGGEGGDRGDRINQTEERVRKPTVERENKGGKSEEKEAEYA